MLLIWLEHRWVGRDRLQSGRFVSQFFKGARQRTASC